MQKETDKRKQRMLDMIRISNKSMYTDVLHYHDYELLKGGKFKARPEMFEPRKAISNLIETFKMHSEAKKIPIKTTFDDKLPEKLKGDRVRICQVLTVMCQNALRYTK